MGLRFYSVHAEPWNPATTPQGADRTVMVKEGFSWPAFLISLPWLIWHRMWIVLLLYLALVIGLAALSEFGQVPDQAMTIASMIIALVLGFEGNGLLRWTLARRGYEEIGEVAAETSQAAEMRFFEKRGHRSQDGAAP
jgi:Protein of unknown function (DUF2628)